MVFRQAGDLFRKLFEPGVLDPSTGNSPFTTGAGSLGYSQFPGSQVRQERAQTQTFGGPQAPNPFVGNIPADAMRPQPRMPSFQDVVGDAPGGGMQSSSSGGFNTNAGLGALADAQRRAASALGSLQAQYEARKAELRQEYQLSETAEERASIQHVLAVIEAQRDAGTQVIERVYGQAIQDAATRSDETRAMGVEAGERTVETFEQAADRAAERLGGLNQKFGGAMGVAGEPLDAVSQGVISDLSAQGAAEGAFDERMFGITADDIGFLGEAMRPEMGAQVGGLQRLAAQTSAHAQAQHSQEVNRRIAAERMQMQQAFQQLAGMFDQRGWGLQDQMIGLDAQRAALAAENQRHAASLRSSSAGRLTPEAEWRLRQAEQQHAIEMERWLAEEERRRQSGFLRNLGLSPEESAAAAEFGIGGQVGIDMIGANQFANQFPI